MPFPFSIRGSIPIPNDRAALSDRAIMLACVEQIEQEGARVISRSDRATVFTAPFFRRWGSNWRFTVPLSGGSLEITSEPTGGRRLSYDLSTRRMALMGTVVAGGMFVFIAAAGPPFPWWIAAFFWLWIVGANYVISLVRAPSWLRRRIADAAANTAAETADTALRPLTFSSKSTPPPNESGASQRHIPLP